MSTNPPFKIDLDRRRPPKQGIYPIVIKITFRGYTSHFRTKFSASEEDFIKAQQGEPQSEHIELLKSKIKAVDTDVRKVIINLRYFTWRNFVRAFNNLVA